MRRSIGVLAVCAGLAAAVGACSHDRTGPTTLSAGARPEVGRADEAVLDVVLTDLLTRVHDPTTSTGDPKTPGYFFAAGMPPWPTKVDQILMRHEEEEWARLTHKQLRAAREGAGDVVRRYEAHDGVAGTYRPADPRVVLWQKGRDEGTPARRGAFAKRPVRAFPPGYSGDGRFAVVALSIPWSMHHADGTYVLEWKGDGRWVILLRQFVYYA